MKQMEIISSYYTLKWHGLISGLKKKKEKLEKGKMVEMFSAW